MDSQQQIKRQLRDIIVKVIPDINPDIGDDDDIFTSGVDSIGAMLLINEIEESFSITLDGDDIPFEKFNTIESIASYLGVVLQRDNTSCS